MTAPTDEAIGLVVQRTSGFADVRYGERIVRCRVRGRLKRGSVETDVVVVGDRVRLRDAGGDALLDEVLPRRTKLARRHPTQARVVEDVLAANVDVVLVCVARSSPTLRPRVLDRYLALAWLGGVTPRIVVTKGDLAPAVDEAETLALYRSLHVPCDVVSVADPAGIEAFGSALAGLRVVLVGPSGAGKSTLANGLVPGLDADVGEVDPSSGRGRHTTRIARMVRSPLGFDLIDTPGIRELSTEGLVGHDVAAYFAEVTREAAGCRFRDCQHDTEPDCAVRAAVAEGRVARVRYESYLAMLRGDDDAPETAPERRPRP